MISAFDTSDRLNFRLRVNLWCGGLNWNVNPFGRPGPFLSSFIFRTSSRVNPDRLISSIVLTIASRLDCRAISNRVDLAPMLASRHFSRRSGGMLLSVSVSVIDVLDFRDVLVRVLELLAKFLQTFRFLERIEITPLQILD